jgi:uncharacterized protein YjiS (DUF1127 family)
MPVSLCRWQENRNDSKGHSFPSSIDFQALSAAAISRIWFGTFVTELGGAWQRHRQREGDFAELQDYSDRDLRELSVSRNDIRWVVDGGNPRNDQRPGSGA